VLPVLYTLWRQHQLRRENRLAVPIETVVGCRSSVGARVRPLRFAGFAVAIAAGVLAPAELSAHGGDPTHAARATDPQTVYVCPMHPEVTSDKPGRCPKCHMKLEPKLTPPAPSSE
jgi:hypothetical protein